MPRQSRGDGQNPWTREGVIRAFRTFRFFRGRLPDERDWYWQDDSTWPSVTTVERLFGSLPEALIAAEEPPTPGARRH